MNELDPKLFGNVRRKGRDEQDDILYDIAVNDLGSPGGVVRNLEAMAFISSIIASMAVLKVNAPI